QLPEGLAIMSIEGGVNFNSVPSHASLEVDIVAGIRNSMARKIRSIYSHVKNLEKEFKNYIDISFEPSHPTLNIGRMETREDYILQLGSCRIPPIVTNEVYEKWMAGLRDSCIQNGAQFRITDYKRPYETSQNSEFVKTLRTQLEEMNLSSECFSQASTNEASILSRVGMECISFGPGIREGNILSPHEFVEIDQLQKAIVFYKKVIERWSA
ncbi:MAG: M20/M25/M40 family metallo-hydrolase, partial [Pseudobdellovibrionaceae bacterium]